MKKEEIMLSVVIPVFNEQESIGKVFEEVRAVCLAANIKHEIIIVNDGSYDKTDEVCRALSPLKYICMRKNFGQTSALDCGFKHSRGLYVAALDGDGQNDPADIPRMLEYLIDNDLDVVSGWRKDRKDSNGKKIVSGGANVLRHMMIHDGIHDSGCTLKIYRRECLEGLDLYGEQHRFIPALLKIKGFRIGEIVVNHRPRSTGKTKYHLDRVYKGFVDMISVWFWNKYASRPLHLLGSGGLFSLLLAFIAAVLTIIFSITGKALNLPLFITALFFISLGVVLFVFGLVSEMIMKTYYRDSGNRPYTVKSVEVFEGDHIEDTDNIS